MNPITAITIGLYAFSGVGLCTIAAIAPRETAVPLILCAAVCFARASYLGLKKG